MRARPGLAPLAALAIALGGISPSFAESASLGFLNRILGGAEDAAGKSASRLASGRLLLADDPASYAIYDSLAGQVRSLEAQIRNESDMLSYYDLQGAVLGSLIELAQRIRELLLQRSSGLLDADDRGAIDSEIGQLYDQAKETLQGAEFNRQSLFPGIEAASPAGLFGEGKFYELESVDALLSYLIGDRAAIGARMEALGFRASGQESESLNTASASSRGDTDFAKELVDLERSHLLALADILMLKREPR